MNLGSATKASILTAAIVGLPILGIAVFAATQSRWLPWLETGSLTAHVVFVSTTALLCGFACLTAQAASIVGGYAFGWQVGTGLSLLGVVLAGLVGYGVFARVIGRRWEALLHRKPRLQAIHDSLEGAEAHVAMSVVGLLRLAPIVPFTGTNLLMAAVRLRKGSFVLGTLLGFAPIATLMAIAGSTIAELRVGARPELSLWITLVLLVLSVAGLSWFARRSLAHVDAG